MKQARTLADDNVFGGLRVKTSQLCVFREDVVGSNVDNTSLYIRKIRWKFAVETRPR